MPSLLEVAAAEVDALAQTAREAIDRRLHRLSDADVSDFWSAVAKLYARGMPDAAVTATSPQPEAGLAACLCNAARSRPAPHPWQGSDGMTEARVP